MGRGSRSKETLKDKWRGPFVSEEVLLREISLKKSHVRERFQKSQLEPVTRELACCSHECGSLTLPSFACSSTSLAGSCELPYLASVFPPFLFCGCHFAG